jgi:hypothetical protein
MQLVRNEIQTPKKVIPAEDRKKPAFRVMMAGLGVVVAGMAAFFLAYILRNYVKENLTPSYRTFQSYGLMVVFIGVLIYLLGARALKLKTKGTTFYKLMTIVKDEDFDPPRQWDYTKPILARLSDLNDKWSMTTEVNPPEVGTFNIPQVIIGPGGVFTLFPLGDHPTKKNFRDPGPLFDKASKALGASLGTEVVPIMVFYTPKVLKTYRKKVEPVTRTITLLDLGDFFEERKQKLTEAQVSTLEAKVYAMIKGTAPGEKFI